MPSLEGGPEKKLSRNTKRSLMMRVRMTISSLKSGPEKKLSRNTKKILLMMISSLRVKSPASLRQPARLKSRVRTRRTKKILMMISVLKSSPRNGP